MTNAGLIYGAAIGDALSLATEGLMQDECSFHYSPDTLTYSDIIRDEYRTYWKKGDWTVAFDQMVSNYHYIVLRLDYVSKTVLTLVPILLYM